MAVSGEQTAAGQIHCRYRDHKESFFKRATDADATGRGFNKTSKRKADSNKGTYGKVLVIAGSEEMSGAGIFFGKGGISKRLRTGQKSLHMKEQDDADYKAAGGNLGYL